MKFAELVPLTAAFVNLGVTLIVLRSGIRPLVNRIYLLWGGSIVVWNVGTTFMFHTDNPQDALFWARFLSLA